MARIAHMEHAELVGLEDVTAAADRGLAPLGPEFAGFVVLEAATRVRDVGGGAVDAASLGIDPTGQVFLTAPPRRVDEPKATAALRKLLASLLEVATSSTPALRACARRREPTSLATLTRELEGALIPLNRAASRRGVARVAKATLEAITQGLLDPSEPSADEEEPAAELSEFAASPPPPVRAPSLPPPLPPPRPAVIETAPSQPDLEDEPEDEALTPYIAPVEPTLYQANDLTPFAAPAWMTPMGDAPSSVDELAAKIDETPAEEVEIVSCLPPEVEEIPAWEAAPAIEQAEPIEVHVELPEPEIDEPLLLETSVVPPAVVAAMPEPVVAAPEPEPEPEPTPEPVVAASEPEPEPPPPPVVPRRDRVDDLLDRFSVSRRRDDPALARDLKAMVGIETSAPPKVAMKPMAQVPRFATRLGGAWLPTVDESSVPLELRIARDARDEQRDEDDRARDALSDIPYEDLTPIPRRRTGGWLAMLALFAILGAAVTTGARRGALASFFAPATPPPGDAPLVAPPAPPSAPATTAAKVPVACEAVLMLDGAASGAEVLRRLGSTPLSVALPMHVPLDLVALLDGMATRRVHVDASAPWIADPTAPRLELPVALEASKEAPWPSHSGSLTPLRAGTEATSRGLVHVTSVPIGATLWLEVEPPTILVPCGTPVDLLVVTGAPGHAAPKPVRIEWSAFTGSPPRATLRL
jgi:hypothetical protein